MSASEKARPVEGRRIVFLDFAVVKFDVVAGWLRGEGAEVECLTEPQKFLENLARESYDVCVINLLVGGRGPFEFIQKVRKGSRNRDIRIIVISRQVQRVNIQHSIRAGANDFVVDPFENENLYHRVLYHLTPKQELDPFGYEGQEISRESFPFLNLLLQATEALSRTPWGNEHGAFLQILQGVAGLLHSNRSSLIIVDPECDSGVVLASSDDPDFYDFPISLHKYPEILHVINTGSFVLVEDVARNALTRKINDEVKTISIGSLMVFPVRFQGEVNGVLTVRRPEATELPERPILRVLQATANTLAAHAYAKSLLRKIYRDYRKAA